MGASVNIIQGLPPEAHDGELAAIDLEIYGIPEGKLHRPVGTFACLSVLLERDLDTGTVYQFYDPADIRDCLARIDKAKWIFQNAKFDIRQMRRWAEIKPRKIWDTMVVDQGLFGGYYASFDLGSLSLRWLKEYLPKDVRETFSLSTEMTDEMKRYAAIDPLVTMRVALAQMDYIAENNVSFEHYWLADHPAVWAILDMAPVKLDTAGWSALAAQFAAEAARLAACTDVKLGSHQKVNAHLCSLLGRKSPLKSTDEESLSELKDELDGKKPEVAAFIDLVQAHRKAAKMAGTYGDNWLRQYVEEGDYIWPDWKPVQALTGRMACGEPNMQNVPAREYPIFRTFFTASEGRVLVGADVAQQEPRILAKLSGDRFLTKTLQEGRSPHVAVGAEIFHDPNFSKKDPRYNLAKQANLGTSYGMTAYGLAQKAGVAVEEAEEFIRHYFRQMSGVKAYIDSYRRLAYRQEYVPTLTGRRAWVNKYTRKWENNAINSPIQGCLPAYTCVLTRAGWLPIGEFMNGMEVWTGAEWASAVRLDRGPAKRLRLHLSDGRTFDCDDRHFLLVNHGTWPEWCAVKDIIGKPLVRDYGDDWGLFARDPEDWYWAGRFIGDGNFTKGHLWAMAFGREEEADVERFTRWLDHHVDHFKGGTNSKRGYSVSIYPGHIRVSGGTKGGVAFWQSFGLDITWASRTKRIPRRVFRLDKVRRTAFLQGYRDADGYDREKSHKITSVNVPLLQDTLQLMQTIGMTGAIGKEQFNGKGVGWHDLYLHKDPATLTVVRIEEFGEETMYTLSVNHPRHAFSTEGLISKNTAADQTKIAVGLMHQWSLTEWGFFPLNLVVHDETVADVPVEAKERFAEIQEAAWREAGRLTLGEDIPLVIEPFSGPNWGAKKE